MNWTIEFFILNMSEKINSIEAIDSLWQILRDLGNIVFIFLIIYAAISLILGSDRNAKDLLPRIIIVALMVNFSLFATQFIIDTSNVFALQIYENISVSGVGDSASVNVSNAIANQVDLSSLNSEAGLESIRDSTDSNTMISILFALSTVVVGILGFVFAAFAALITIRFFVLIFIMIASPIGFIAFALPGNNFGETWFDYLISQSFFAPALMLMLYLTLYLGKSMKGDLFSGDLADAIISPSGNIDILIFYVLMVGMLIGSLIVAQRMGAVGADKTVSVGKSLGGAVSAGAAGVTAGGAAYLGRTSAGRGGRRLADSERFKRWEEGEEGKIKQYLGQQIRRAGEATAGSSFDVRNTSAVEGGGEFNRREGGFDEAVQDQEEFRQQRKESLEELSPKEKEEAAKAKSKKQQKQDAVKKQKEKLDDRKDAIDENVKRDKEPLEEQIDDLKESLDNRESDYKEEKDELDSELSKVEGAIEERDRLRERLSEAQDNNNKKLQKQLLDQWDSLSDEITTTTSGVSDLDDLESKKGSLENEKQTAKQDFKNHKSRYEAEIESREDKIDDLESKAEDQKKSIDLSKKQLDDELENFEERMDKIIEVGKRRGEGYTETMVEQQSTLDNMVSYTKGVTKKIKDGSFELPDEDELPRSAKTTKTQGNRAMAMEEFDNLSDEKQEEISKKL